MALTTGAAGVDDLLGAPGGGVALGLFDEGPRLIFYAAYDDDAAGVTADYRLENVGTAASALKYEPGVRGRAVRCGSHTIAYPATEIIGRARGSLSFWFKRDAQPASGGSGLRRGAQMVNGAFAFSTARFDVGRGQWQHWVITWETARNAASLYRNGERVEKLALRDSFQEGTLRLGFGLPGLLDEVAVFGHVLSPGEMAGHRQRVLAGEAGWPAAATLRPSVARYPLAIGKDDAARPSPPPAVNWTLPAAQAHGVRRRYPLDGLWRVQPCATRAQPPPAPGAPPPAQDVRAASDYTPKATVWGYVAIPGSWRARDTSLILDARAETPVPQWNGVPVSLYSAAWLEREFTWSEPLPAGAGLFLVCKGSYDVCDFYLNGTPVGTGHGGVFDITESVRVGALPNRLTVLAGRPYGTYRHTDREGKTVWDSSGLRDAVYLELRPARHFSVVEVYTLPSFRNKRLGVELLVSNTDAWRGEMELQCEIEEQATGSRNPLGKMPLQLDGTPRQRVTVAFPWADPVLWFPDEPKLLNLHLSLRRGEQLIDGPPPIRFGFSEVWTDGGNMVMNGVPFRIRGAGNGWESRGAAVRDLITFYRARGMNAAIGWFLGSPPPETLEAALRVADEMGFISAFNIYMPQGSETQRLESLRDTLSRLRNHPCVYGYVIGDDPYCFEYSNDPISLGRPPAAPISNRCG